MATGDYCTLGELKARVWPDGATPDGTNDLALSSIITAVSRLIENFCGRRFYTTAADETRYFDTEDNEYLWPSIDIVSVTSLHTDRDGDRTYADTWATTDYDLEPLNAALDSRPYSWLHTTPDGVEDFPEGGRKSIRIIGKFGWSAVPAAVREACLLQCMRIYKRRDAPFGMISNPVGGEVRLLNKIDPDLELLLAAYRRID
jgi:hypothetical protein